MSGIICIGNIVFECLECGATNRGSDGVLIRSTTIWANQHGRKLRLFCQSCGAWYDHTDMNGKVTARRVKRGGVELINNPAMYDRSLDESIAAALTASDGA